MQRVSMCLGACAALAGCTADNGDEAIIVLKNVHAGENCVATNAINEIGWSRGTLDLAWPSSYVFVAQLKSRITALAGQEDQRTIFTSGANVDITFPGSTFFSDAELAELKAARLTQFKDPFVAPITPGGVVDVPFSLIPDALVERVIAKADLTSRFRLEALATFTVVGEMAGGEVSSQAFAFAVTLGNGLVVNVAGACDALDGGFMARTGYACNPAQDGVVDCCTEAGGLVCPARATPTTP